jgi:peptide/nickel transport system permease protein
MIRYIIRRLLWAVVLFIAVTLVTFVIFYLIPVDPARLAAGRAATPAEVQEVAHRLYLDKPIWQQYGHFLEQLVIHGNLGYSYANRQSVNDIIRSAAPITASLVIGAAILWMLIAIPIGVLSALRPRSLLDRTSMVFVLIGISVHPVWLALVGSYLLGYVPTSGQFLGFSFPSFTLFPIQGYCAFTGAAPGEQCGGPVDWFYHLILPWSVFAFLYAAFYVRLVRSQVMEVQNEDYVRTARAKGAPERRVLMQHVLRNAMLPVVTAFGMDVALALGGAVLLETVYGLPGLGYVAIKSLSQFDYPITLGVVVFASVVVIIFNLIVDLLYAWIDPRIRLG